MKKTLLPFLFLCISLSLNAQQIITLKDTGDWYPIGKQTAFFRDPGSRSIQAILQPTIQSKFQKYNQDEPSFGGTTDAIWFKFTAGNVTDKQFFLHIGSAFIDSIALYAVTNNQVREVQLSGDNYVFTNRPLKVNTFLFPLNIKSGEQQEYLLRVKTMQPFFFPLRVGTLDTFMEDTHKLDLIQGIYLGFMLLIFLYNLFLYFSTKENIYLYYVAYVFSITWFMSTVYQYVFEFIWPNLPVINQFAVASSGLTILTATLFTREFLHTSRLAPRSHKFSIVFICLGILCFVLVFTPLKIPALMLAQSGIMLMAVYFLVTGVIVYRKGYNPAKFYLVAWSFLITGFIAAILESLNILPVMYYINSMQIGSAIEVTLLSLALADRINIYKKQREEAHAKALRMAHEQSEFVLQQNIQLEQKVTERTMALTKSLDELKITQAQLIQSEKMASLGELTSGIAHEIQNPLNFINNFSEVNIELLEEMTDEIKGNNPEQILILLNDIKENNRRTMFHGKRADDIIKGMLQHSRTNTGKKELTNINALCDEYLRLSYHGFRAKDKSFTCDFKTNFDETIGEINIVPQDIGRVLLNLYNNAFYAVKAPNPSRQDKPIVQVKTGKALSVTGDPMIEITVSDNGTGIPQSIINKIFQPFFTTKPTGQGTGLGLSLAYDVIKAHNGELKVETQEGKGTTFIIQLPNDTFSLALIPQADNQTTTTT